MVATVEINDIGPVHHASIPVPEHGGVVVLKARNGRGKSLTLDAVESAMTGRGKPSVRDGMLSGSVSAFGVTMTVARSTRRSGELEVTSLDGKLSVADLVDPKLKSPEAADARRIKALIQVTGVEPSPELFYDLFGGRDEFEKVVSSAATDCTDLVLMAEKIKRDCEAAARKAESEADHEQGRSKGAMEAAGSVPEPKEHDADVLQKRLEEALEARSRINAEVKAGQEARDAAELAQRRLDDAEASYDGPSLAKCKQDESAWEKTVSDANEDVRKAEEILANARAHAEQSRNQLGAAITARKNAERHESMISQWREQIESTLPAMPSEEAVRVAAEAVEEARLAVEKGTLYRQAKAKLIEAKTHAQFELSHRKRAVKLRNAAKGADDVLSSVVSQTGTPLKVLAGRLVVETKRGQTYYGELSHGERWRIALDVAIQAVGKGGVIVLQQEAWEGLDPIAREAIASQVKGTEVVVLTAECSIDEDVSAEVFA